MKSVEMGIETGSSVKNVMMVTSNLETAVIHDVKEKYPCPAAMGYCKTEKFVTMAIVRCGHSCRSGSEHLLCFGLTRAKAASYDHYSLRLA